jgi:hypothetical protein
VIPAHLEALRWAAATERPGMADLDYPEPDQQTLLRLAGAGLIEPVWTEPREDVEQFIYAAKLTEAGRAVLAQQEPAPAHIGDDGWWVPKGGYSGKETLLELESRFGPNPPADPGEPYESEQEAAYWRSYRERHPDSTREWVVERAWRVRARTAQDAIEKAEPGAHDFIRVYEGTEPRPWEAT